MAYTTINALPWPDLLKLRERALQWIPDFSMDASPPSLDGSQQFGTSNGGGLWKANLTGVQIRRPEHVLAWLAFEVQLRGGQVPVDVPLLLDGYQPLPASGASVVVRATNGGWAARAISGRVELINIQALEPGQHFSDYDPTIYGWRLYRIDSVSLSSGDLANITFWPPARFAVADAHPLEFDAPRCVMRLAGSGSTDFEIQLRRRGDPNAEFIEAGG